MLLYIPTQFLYGKFWKLYHHEVPEVSQLHELLIISILIVEKIASQNDANHIGAHIKHDTRNCLDFQIERFTDYMKYNKKFGFDYWNM